MSEDQTGANLLTQYTHDLLGDLLSANKCAATGCGSGQTRTFAYDSLGRLTSAANPESGSTSYTYDNNGNVKTKLDANGVTTTYGYDVLNRLTSKTYSDGTSGASYVYDSYWKGALASSSKGGVTTTYNQYSSLGLVTQTVSQLQAGGATYTTGYNYDLSGALKTESYPSGRILTTTYDSVGRPTTVSSSGNSTPYVSSMNYWPHGAPYYYQFRNNVWPVNTFNQVLEPSSSYATIGNSPNYWMLYIANNWNTNTTLGSVNEGYGPAVTWSNMTWVGQTYGYDNLNRVTSALDNGWSRNFSYDEYGNMSLTANSGVPLNGLTPQKVGSNPPNPYNAANNRLLSANYDSAGNAKLIGSLSISYDAEGEQTQTSDSVLHLTASYVYDADGQRVQKTAGGVTTSYVHDAFGQLTAEYTTAAPSTPPCTTCYLTYDHLGSVRMVTDQNGVIITRHDYLPYGEEIPSGSGGRNGNQFAAASNVNQMFTGQERDSENAPALDFFDARYMSAVLGSFTRPDPYNAGADITNPQSWNGYAYVLGNPLANVDPSGMCTSSDGSPCFDGTSKPACKWYQVSCWFGAGEGGGTPEELDQYTEDWIDQGLASGVPLFTVTGTGVAGRNPQPVSTPAKNGTATCTGTATFTGVGGKQARADGALFSKYPAQAGGSIRGGTFGTVAVQNGFLGLTTRQLRTYGTQIFVTPGNQSLIQQYKGPTGPLSVSDYGDANVQAAPGVAFDIYRFPTVTAGRQFGRQVMSTTISFPIASGGSCPAGFTQVP